MHNFDHTKPLPLLKRLYCLFFAPKTLLSNIASHNTIVPLIIVFAALGLISAVPAARLGEITLHEQMAVLEQEFGEAFKRLSENELFSVVYAQGGGVSYVSTVISSVITPFVSSFFASLGLYILIFLFQLKAKFSQLYCMYAHIFIVTMLCAAAAAFISVRLGTSVNMLSLAALYPGGANIFDPVYAALSAVSLGTLWQAALTFLGVMAFCKTDALRAAAICFTYLIFSIVFSAMSSILAGYTFSFMQEQISKLM